MGLDIRQSIWFEKHRPTELDQCILPDRFRSQFERIIETNQLPNLLFASRAPGSGKTTVATILCEKLGYDYIMINGSKDRNLDMLRNKIEGFAGTGSFDGERKCIIIDEADFLNPQSTQPALRGVIEEYSENCSFIFTCNQIDKLSEAIQSRFIPVIFEFLPAERNDMLLQAFERVFNILDLEGVTYDKQSVATVIKKHYPKFRNIINLLQGLALSGTIDSYSVTDFDSTDALIESLKKSDWTGILEWCANNADVGIDYIVSMMENNADSIFVKKSQPAAFIIMADYQDKATRAYNQSINLKAMLSEFLMELQFV